MVQKQEAGKNFEEFQQIVLEGRFEDAENWIERQLQGEPPLPAEMLSHIGYYDYKRGNYARAVWLLEQRVQKIGADLPLCRIMVECYANLKNFSKASAWLKHAEELGEQPARRYAARLGLSWRNTKHRLRQWGRRSSFYSFQRQALFVLGMGAVALVERLYEISGDERAEPFLRFLWTYDPEAVKEGFAYHKTREVLLAQRCAAKCGNNALILDVGTGKNTAPLFWAKQGRQVYTFDGSLYGVNRFQQVREAIPVDISSFHFVCGNSCSIPLGDEKFHFVSVLCVLEHIPHEGDRQTMQEIHRILKPGGLVLLTTETAPKSSEEWLPAAYEIGYQVTSTKPTESKFFLRNYTASQMKERLADTSKWEIMESGFYDDTILPIRTWLNQPKYRWLSFGLTPLQPLLSILFYQNVKQPQTPSSIGYLLLRKKPEC